MAESHELCEYLDSLPKNQELQLTGLDKWAKSNDFLTGKTSAKGLFTNTLLLKVKSNCKKQHQKSIDLDKPQQSKNCLAWHNLVRPCCFCWQPWLPQRYFEVTLTLGNKGSSGNTENERQMELKAIFQLTKTVEYIGGANRSQPQNYSA